MDSPGMGKGIKNPLRRAEEKQGSSRWEIFLDKFIETYFSINPDFAVNAGRHEFDGRLPDWRPEKISSDIRWLREQHDLAFDFDPGSLDSPERFERDYLTAMVRGDLFWLDSARWPFRNPYYYLPSLDPNVYVLREYAPIGKRMEAYVSYAGAIPSALKLIRENLAVPLPPTYADLGMRVFRGLADYCGTDVRRYFEETGSEGLRREFHLSNGRAVSAMMETAGWFGRQHPEPAGGFELGPELLAGMLGETEMVHLPLDELEEMGRRDLERNLRALHDACSSYAPGRTVKECAEYVNAIKPEGGPVKAAVRQLRELRDFLVSKDLVTVPDGRHPLVRESPSFMRWNLAYMDIPGMFDGDLPPVYYISPPDPSWSGEERDLFVPGESNLLFVSAHEVWPGHFLQRRHAVRTCSKLAGTFSSYAFSEGWAHYAEEMMWDAGLGEGAPCVRTGMLLNALLRNVRFLSAIGLHSGKMTPAESERMFRETAFQDPGSARQQAMRGTFDPAYLNYTLGKMMIMKLRKDWMGSKAGKGDLREFHDILLSYGAPPVPLVRREMLGHEDGGII